ncbi:S-adenosyl-L-methionine-dependent methyltransferase [Ophiobolus disseminans]|uniref:S-adenosyl-L-methionine-dependent methyltransferase n=1 Tax=Ophiobolus disseminans TaxID=1469910 RepID=A0A6A7A779_9PLEO|nr:S-adenosyl-L-methionine-dependent methyltransferase [Ophiobolus disseminans]
MANPPKSALEHFNISAARYEKSTGSCTRELARHLIKISPSFGTGSHVLDNACGTGIVAQEILFEQYAGAKTPPKISCTDGAAVMVDMARAACNTTIDANKHRTGEDLANISFDAVPGEALGFPDNHFTHSITNQGIMFFKDAEKGASEIHRTLQPGGTAIVTTWKEIPYVSMIQAGQKVVTPGAPLFRIPISEQWSEASYLEKTLRDVGFGDVEVHEKQVHYAFKTVEELCELVLVLFGHMVPDLSDQQKTDFRKQFKIEAEKVLVKTERLITGDMEGRKEELVGLKMVALVAVAKK